MPEREARRTARAASAQVGAVPAPGKLPLESGTGITLRRLQIFWAVAHSDSLTKAGKLLGLAQPSLSQQISNLEESVGAALFDRRSNRMTLTEAGARLLRDVEPVLSSMQRLEEGLIEVAEGRRQTIRLAGVNSVLRVLLPRAMRALEAKQPNIDYDVHESAPAEVLEMLYGRHVSLGLIGRSSIAEVGAGFMQVPILEDPYVLAVPEGIALDRISDPRRDLSAEDYRTLSRSIQFAFGTPHARRVQMWYDQAIPGSLPFAQARSFEVALGMVGAGLGVCLAPVLSSVVGDRAIPGLRLYRVAYPPRQIVALLPGQYARQQPYQALVEALQDVGRTYEMPRLHDTPPFLIDCDAILAGE